MKYRKNKRRHGRSGGRRSGGRISTYKMSRGGIKL